MKATAMKPTTLQYPANTSKAGYRQLKQTMLRMGHLHNTLIRHRDSARGSHRHAFNLSLPNTHRTDLHRHDPTFKQYARRLLESVTREVNKSYRTYFKHPDISRPNTASPYQNRTLAISEPSVEHLKVKPNGWATIRIKGLPTIKLQTDERIPKGKQPKAIRITLQPRRLVVSLVYQQKPKDLGEPPKRSVGIDPGVKHNITAVSDDGAVLQRPGFDSRPHRKVKHRLIHKLQRQRDAALKDGRARFTSQRTRAGKNKRRFRWVERPSKTYLKTLAQLRRVEQKRQDSMRGYQHRLSHQLVRNHQTICIEDTQTSNLTRSAKGTAAEPGANVSQKTGLNRSILAQGWYGLRTKLEYKAEWYGRQFVPVPAHHTSQRCSACGHVAAGNRPSQSVFRCTNCGHEANADVNTAENIQHLGLTARARAGEPLGVPL